MQKPIKIGIMTDHTYMPDRVGGRESSIHDLTTSFQLEGHKVRVIANRGRRIESFKFLIPRLMWRKYYQVDRVNDERKHTENLLRSNKIDIAIYNCRYFERYISTDREIYTRQFFYVRDAEDIASLRPQFFPLGTHFLANSKFIADKVEKYTGIKPVIVYPLINPNRYLIKIERRFVTFINPVREKGLELALEIAKLCNEIPFQFVESWPLGSQGFEKLKNQLSPFSNISLIPAVLDMKQIYSQTNLLLAPSQWEEGFGRVAIEAQISGIPVLASDIGGLPEAVGDGGVLIPPDADPFVWANVLRDIWYDDVRWNQLSTQARQHAQTYYEQSFTAVSRILKEIQ